MARCIDLRLLDEAEIDPVLAHTIRMIRIAITAPACHAICSTLPEDAPVGPSIVRTVPPRRGGRPRPSGAMRRPAGSYGDVILRLAATDGYRSPAVCRKNSSASGRVGLFRHFSRATIGDDFYAVGIIPCRGPLKYSLRMTFQPSATSSEQTSSRIGFERRYLCQK